MVVGTVVSVVFGSVSFSYDWGLPTAVNGLNDLVSGAILALLFGSPLAEEFASGSVNPENALPSNG